MHSSNNLLMRHSQYLSTGLLSVQGRSQRGSEVNSRHFANGLRPTVSPWANKEKKPPQSGAVFCRANGVGYRSYRWASQSACRIWAIFWNILNEGKFTTRARGPPTRGPPL